VRKDKLKRKKGTFLITIGLLLLAAALGLTGYNIYESKQAAKASEDALYEIETVIEENEKEQTDVQMEGSIPIYEQFPEKEMPMIEIDGNKYIGIIDMPEIGITLPVMGGQWSYPKLRKAPCLYAGSVYKDNMVIAAHNYGIHFGKIKNLSVGSEITFTDVEGNVFYYEVGWLDVMDPRKTEEIKDATNWDLSLFTCTYGGKERYVLRCIRKVL
jgi:sortase A